MPNTTASTFNRPPPGCVVIIRHYTVMPSPPATAWDFCPTGWLQHANGRTQAHWCAASTNGRSPPCLSPCFTPTALSHDDLPPYLLSCAKPYRQPGQRNSTAWRKNRLHPQPWHFMPPLHLRHAANQLTS